VSAALLTELTKLLGRRARNTISPWGQLRERAFAVFRGNAARESAILEKISRPRCVILLRTDSLAEPHNPSHGPEIPLFDKRYSRSKALIEVKQNLACMHWLLDLKTMKENGEQ
jgi:hypothetical protein